MHVICFGDSNTYGYDPRSYFGGRYPGNHRWVDILALKTGWTIINEGMNGREIPRKGIEFPKTTDLLIVMLGTNDLLQGNDAGETAAKMESFLCALTIEPSHILLVAPPPMKLGEWVKENNLIMESVQLAKNYQALSKRLCTHFADAGVWNISLAFDGVHFTQEAHRVFADQLYKICKRVESGHTNVPEFGGINTWPYEVE